MFHRFQPPVRRRSPQSSQLRIRKSTSKLCIEIAGKETSLIAEEPNGAKGFLLRWNRFSHASAGRFQSDCELSSTEWAPFSGAAPIAFRHFNEKRSLPASDESSLALVYR